MVEWAIFNFQCDSISAFQFLLPQNPASGDATDAMPVLRAAWVERAWRLILCSMYTKMSVNMYVCRLHTNISKYV